MMQLHKFRADYDSDTSHNYYAENETTREEINNETFLNSSWTDEAICSTGAADTFLSSYIFHFCVYLMYFTIFIIAITGNGLVCFVVQNTPRMKTVTNYFIMNLAIGDILMTLFCVPFSFVSMLLLRYWPFGTVMCKIVNYVQAVSVFVSAYTLLAISIDRYMAIMRPLRPRLGKTVATMVVTSVWGSALATAAPIFIVSQIERPTEFHEYCKLDICLEKWAHVEQSKQYSCVLMVLQFGLPLGALVCTYSRIALAVWGGRPPGEAQTTRDLRIQQSKRKMIKMMVTVVTVFVVCWLPLNLFIILWTIYEQDEKWGTWPGIPYVWFASHWLAMSHCCYNPIIYCYMNKRYRHGFKQVLGCLLRNRVDQPSRSYQRSSMCDGIPMSEFVCPNGVVRRGTSSSYVSRVQRVPNTLTTSVRRNHSQLSGNLSRNSLTTPPVRALSLRKDFN